MTKLADASINSFARVGTHGYVPPEDPIFEVSASELQGLLNEMAFTYNMMAELLQDTGILRGRELAGLIDGHSTALKAEKSPLTKILLLNVYTRKLMGKARDGLKGRPTESGKVVQVCSKVMARAIKIVDYIKTLAQDPKRKEIALDSQQARILFQGAGGEPVSRKETIRAMRRAEKLWPALECSHRPNDGRQTTRLTATVEELQDQQILGYCDLWQRSGKSLCLGL